MSGVDYDFLEPRIRTLTQNSEEIAEVGKEVYEGEDQDREADLEYKELSIIKLILFTVVVDLYTSIIPSPKTAFDDMFYIDCLAGSGITHMEGRDTILLGSAILAPTLAETQFDQLYFVEQNDDRRLALERRLEYIQGLDNVDLESSDYQVYGGDCNEQIYEIVEDLDSRSGQYKHHLAFVDNEGLDTHWSTMKEILNAGYCDLLINYPYYSLGQTNRSNGEQAFTGFFGDEYWREYQEKGMIRSKELRDEYLERIDRESIRHRVSEPINAPSTKRGSMEYDIIYTAGRGDSGGGFMNRYRYYQDKITGNTEETVERVLDAMEGNTEQLADFFDYEEDEDNEDTQSALKDF
jgi:three-Cys-motif partner protein